ncbi:DNA repair protein RecN [Shouchella shacheensis]|uniref:DNA repair protein RecN n=1 Tax=Shouchella shacheensis TaxID=1649580 RepID=UPI00073FBC6B|nr:DNA repair protein RecN [Shouchella shacheensis]
MLMELSIKNFAIIDALSVPFDKGLTVLTGETGAGKSIIIDAIGLLLGGRGSAEFVRYGEKRAEIDGLFSVDDKHPVRVKLESLGIELEEGMLILRREITQAGKSICRINGKLTTLGVLREVGQTLIDVHGQHEHQSLMQVDEHVRLLDSFSGAKMKETLAEYQRLYRQAQKFEAKRKEMNQNSQEMARRIDLYTYQLSEIEKAELAPNEDEQLSQERHKLANSEKLFEALNLSYDHLYGEERGLDFISGAVSHLEEAVAVDEELKPLYESVSSGYYLLEEASFSLREAVDQIDFNPERLKDIENRLAEIEGLKRKYGESVEAVLEYAAKIEEQLHEMEHKDDRVAELKDKLEAIWSDIELEAEALTDVRKQTAAQLMDSIQEQLQALYMEKTRFQVAIENRPPSKPQQAHAHGYTESGKDRVEFLISTNQGEPMKPLAKIASGGEISRIMLALKSIFSFKQGITSVIFDEVDTGVSGRVAQAIAEKIQQISTGSQVLCITHLPQVAAMADHHLFIAKHEGADRVTTSVQPLEAKEKVNEIARMLSGVEITDLTRQHATELLDMAREHKEGIRKAT